MDKHALNSAQSWSASNETNNIPERDYIQFDFKNSETVAGIDLQGRKDEDQWVTKFKVMASTNGTDFKYVFDGKEFDGN